MLAVESSPGLQRTALFGCKRCFAGGGPVLVAGAAGFVVAFGSAAFCRALALESARREFAAKFAVSARRAANGARHADIVASDGRLAHVLQQGVDLPQGSA